MSARHPPVQVEIRDAVAILTLDDPARRNCLSDAMIDELVGALDRFDHESDVRCLVLTGRDPAFCSGADAKELGAGTGHAAGGSVRLRRSLIDRFQRLPHAFARLETPIVAAVNGTAIGAGCDLALMCDIRIASERARFVEVFAELGVISGDGGAWLLPRLVGLSRALEMTLTADPVDARTAAGYGLVSRVVAHESLMDEALALARRISRHPAHAVRLGKRLVRLSAESSLAAGLELAANMQAACMLTMDHREALVARNEKRPPRFVGE